MPKDEFDFDDPFELNGVGVICSEDTTDAMTECFVEEFMRLGYNHKQILALFRNPHYIGMNLALEKRGEQFVHDTITEVFARRGKAITWPIPAAHTAIESITSPPTVSKASSGGEPAASGELPDGSLPPKLDPMGAPIPALTL